MKSSTVSYKQLLQNQGGVNYTDKYFLHLQKKYISSIKQSKYIIKKQSSKVINNQYNLQTQSSKSIIKERQST